MTYYFCFLCNTPKSTRHKSPPPLRLMHMLWNIELNVFSLHHQQPHPPLLPRARKQKVMFFWWAMMRTPFGEIVISSSELNEQYYVQHVYTLVVHASCFVVIFSTISSPPLVFKTIQFIRTHKHTPTPTKQQQNMNPETPYNENDKHTMIKSLNIHVHTIPPSLPPAYIPPSTLSHKIRHPTIKRPIGERVGIEHSRVYRRKMNVQLHIHYMT